MNQYQSVLADKERLQAELARVLDSGEGVVSADKASARATAEAMGLQGPGSAEKAMWLFWGAAVTAFDLFSFALIIIAEILVIQAGDNPMAQVGRMIRGATLLGADSEHLSKAIMQAVSGQASLAVAGTSVPAEGTPVPGVESPNRFRRGWDVYQEGYGYLDEGEHVLTREAVEGHGRQQVHTYHKQGVDKYKRTKAEFESMWTMVSKGIMGTQYVCEKLFAYLDVGSTFGERGTLCISMKVHHQDYVISHPKVLETIEESVFVRQEDFYHVMVDVTRGMLRQRFDGTEGEVQADHREGTPVPEQVQMYPRQEGTPVPERASKRIQLDTGTNPPADRRYSEICAEVSGNCTEIHKLNGKPMTWSTVRAINKRMYGSSMNDKIAKRYLAQMRKDKIID